MDFTITLNYNVYYNFLQLFHHWLFHQGPTVEILVGGQQLIVEILVAILG